MAWLFLNPWRSAFVFCLAFMSAAIVVQHFRLVSVTKDRDAKVELLAEIDAVSDAARAEAERQRDEATAERDRLLANLPTVGNTIIKEREVHYAQNPAAASAVCLPADRVSAVNSGIGRLATAAGVEPVPGEAPAGKRADR